MGRAPCLAFALASLAAGCAAPAGGGGADARCQLVAWYRPDRAMAAAPSLTAEQAARPELIGSWNGFQRPGLRAWDRRRAAPEGEAPVDWYTISLPLPAGAYEYAIVAGDQLLLDAVNPQSAFAPSPLLRGDAPFAAELSRAVIPDCGAPALAARPPEPGAASLRVTADFLPAQDGAPLGEASAELHRGEQVLAPPAIERIERDAEGAAARVIVAATALPPGKYTVTIRARDSAGRDAAPVRASAFVTAAAAPTPALGDGLVYHLVVDRFRGPAGALGPPRTPGARAGGTLDGVRAAVEAGYFDALGVTTLWLSPVYQNPPGTWTGRDGRSYEAYHGYWPAQPRAVEERLGGAAALDALVAAAHARGLRVLIDAVPNHVHDSHPYYQDRSRRAPAVAAAPDPAAASWFNDGPASCVCGSPGCGWGERLEDCWFDRYLPDLNWRSGAVLEGGAADLGWWMERFDLDGLRIDAVPMMPRAATRRIARVVRQATARGGLDGLLLGETYTGPGDYGRAEIRAFLGQRHDGLDSQFDFPLMWALRDVIARGARGFDALEQELAAGERAFAGSGAAIAHILGNHDTSRFLSEAAGDAGADPWLGPPQPTAEAPYRLHLLGLAAILTLPGLPVLYYGDEVALAGAGDPDCRRVLPDVLAARPPLSAPQAQVLEGARRLGRLRRCASALRRGQRRPLLVTADHDVAWLAPPADDPAAAPALVVLSRAPGAARLRVSGVPAGAYRDALSGRVIQVGQAGAAAEIDAAPLSAAVYLSSDSPAGSACLQPPADPK